MKQTQQTPSNQPLTVPNERQFVTTAEIAVALGITDKNVRELIAKGQLQGKRIGGRWRMHRDDFARLIAPPEPPTIDGASVHTERPDAA